MVACQFHDTIVEWSQLIGNPPLLTLLLKLFLDCLLNVRRTLIHTEARVGRYIVFTLRVCRKRAELRSNLCSCIVDSVPEPFSQSFGPQLLQFLFDPAAQSLRRITVSLLITVSLSITRFARLRTQTGQGQVELDPADPFIVNKYFRSPVKAN